MDVQEVEKIRAIKEDAEQVKRLYELFCEDKRLNHSKAARVEFLTTIRYLEKYLKPQDRILDIGAGAGEYSLYLADQDYTVDALELSPANVAAFRKKIKPHHRIQLRQGNALDLSCYPDETFDVVLLLGPLYHLHQKEDRKQCIQEAKRVCKKDGLILFSFISHDMVILTEFAYNPNFFRENTYDHDTLRLEDFPFVFFTVEECRNMLEKQGIRLLHQVASDGMSELLADKINAMDDYSYSQYLRYHYYSCEKPELLGCSNHLLFLGNAERRGSL